MVSVITPAEYSHLTARAGRRAAALIRITARQISSGAPVTAGFWTGPDHQEFVVEGAQQLYYGAGGLISVDPIRAIIGLDVQQCGASFALHTPEVTMAVRGYELRQAEVMIHRALFNPLTDELIGISRRFKGQIDQVVITEPTEAEPGSCQITMVGSARRGTRVLALKKSDASQRLRNRVSGGEDRFARYSDISGAVPARWGVQ